MSHNKSQQDYNPRRPPPEDGSECSSAKQLTDTPVCTNLNSARRLVTGIINSRTAEPLFPGGGAGPFDGITRLSRQRGHGFTFPARDPVPMLRQVGQFRSNGNGQDLSTCSPSRNSGSSSRPDNTKTPRTINEPYSRADRIFLPFVRFFCAVSAVTSTGRWRTPR